MRNIIFTPMKIIFLPALLLIFQMANAQSSFLNEKLFLPKPSAIAYFTTGNPTIDGDINEAAWEAAPWITHFSDISGNGDTAFLPTKIKLLWNKQAIYIAAEMETPNVWSNITQNDVAIYMDDALELFFDPDGDTHNYFELEINANNQVMDMFLAKPYRDGGATLLSWDVKGWQHAIKVNGTLNNGNDTDKNWMVEMAIPFNALRVKQYALPHDGDIWRMNFFRVLWDVDFIDGKYQKKKDQQTGKIADPHYWTWSPQGLVDIHYPERWGYVEFSKKQNYSPSDTVSLPDYEKWKNFLWRVYYSEKNYFSAHRHYTSSLNKLKIDRDKIKPVKAENDIKLESTSLQFLLTLIYKNKDVLQIDQEGKLTVHPFTGDKPGK
jgi:hypothetical protein